MAATGYHVAMDEPAPIPGFTFRGGKYRSGVALDAQDARAIARMAESEGAPVGAVLRRLVRSALGRKMAAGAVAGGSRGE